MVNPEVDQGGERAFLEEELGGLYDEAWLQEHFPGDSRPAELIELPGDGYPGYQFREGADGGYEVRHVPVDLWNHRLVQAELADDIELRRMVAGWMLSPASSLFVLGEEARVEDLNASGRVELFESLRNQVITQIHKWRAPR